jgi:hypothetical protein
MLRAVPLDQPDGTCTFHAKLVANRALSVLSVNPMRDSKFEVEYSHND